MKKIWNHYSFAIILILLSCTLALMLSFRFHSDDRSQFLKVTVSEGDSIWKISQHYSGRHTLSNDEFISWVEKYNKIDGDQIFPGEEIIIPVKNETSELTEFASSAGK